MGVLPEPERRANGYRSYDLRDLVRLVRVRRLVALGLSLPEVRDVVRDGRPHEATLREVLEELDADLARQQADLAARRATIAGLLRRDRDLASSDDVAAVLATLAAAAPGADPAALDGERDLLEAVEAHAGPEALEQLGDLYRVVLADEDVRTRTAALAERFAALADRPEDHPEVEAVAAAIASAEVPGPVTPPSGDAWDATWEAFLRTLPAAQRRCLQLVADGLP